VVVIAVSGPYAADLFVKGKARHDGDIDAVNGNLLAPVDIRRGKTFGIRNDVLFRIIDLMKRGRLYFIKTPPSYLCSTCDMQIYPASVKNMLSV
jgi:hypothetical protein